MLKRTCAGTVSNSDWLKLSGFVISACLFFLLLVPVNVSAQSAYKSGIADTIVIHSWGDNGTDFFVLYNPTDKDVSLQNLWFARTTGSGGWDNFSDVVKVQNMDAVQGPMPPPQRIIPAGGFMSFARDGGQANFETDHDRLDYFYGGFPASSTDNGLALFWQDPTNFADSEAARQGSIDAVGVRDAPVFEGEAVDFGASMSLTSSALRHPASDSGSFLDQDVNIDDFLEERADDSRMGRHLGSDTAIPFFALDGDRSGTENQQFSLDSTLLVQTLNDTQGPITGYDGASASAQLTVDTGSIAPQTIDFTQGEASDPFTISGLANDDTVVITVRDGAASGTHALFVNSTATLFPDTVAFATQPDTAMMGTTISDSSDNPLRVEILNEAGNLDPTVDTPVTIQIDNDPSGSATLSGSTTVQATNGVAEFDDLSIDEPGSGYTFRVTADGVSSTVSESFTILSNEIASCGDFDVMRQNLTEDFIQTATVDCGSVTNFEPIGDNGTPFTGSFSGEGFEIQNLDLDGNADYAGLFGVIGSGGQVDQLTLNGVELIREPGGVSEAGGGLVGLNKGRIDTAVVIVQSGQAIEGGASAVAGGMVGINEGEIRDSLVVLDGEVRNALTTTSVGGFAGTIDGGPVQQSAVVGRGSVVIDNDETVGGFASEASAGLKNDELSNIYVTVTVDASGANAAANVGGLIGDFGTSRTVGPGYMAGSIKPGPTTPGGLIGSVAFSNPKGGKLYWDVEAVGVETDGADESDSLATVDMAGSRAQSTLGEFDFTNVWTVTTRADTGQISYPYFAWQTDHFPVPDTRVITANAAPGTITLDPAASGYVRGETVAVEATAGDTLVFSNWSISPDSGTLAETENASTVYTVGDTDVTLTATFIAMFEGTIPDQQELEDTGSWSISLAEFASDTVSGPLKWTVVDGADTLVNSNLDNNAFYAGGIDTLTLTPKQDKFGTSAMTLSLGNGEDTASQSFRVTLVSVNDTPIISPTLADVAAREGTDPIVIPLVDNAFDSDGDPVKWTVADGADTLVTSTLSNNAYTSGGMDTLTLTTKANASGISSITLSLGDGEDTAQEMFQVDITQFADGDGTPGDPFHVADWVDLHELRNQPDSHYLLVGDLDSTSPGYDTYVSDPDSGWAPIEPSPDQFGGSLDGDQHSISDLVIDRPGADHVGLFGRIAGSVKDLLLIDVNVTGGDNVGGLAGSITNTVNTIHVSGTVTGGDNVGGVVGLNSNGTVRAAYSTADVSGNQQVGGLVGSTNGGSVETSYAAGAVSGTTNVGGLQGSLVGGTVNSAYWDTYVTNQDSSAGGTPRTTVAMAGAGAPGNLAGFDFSDSWSVTTRSDPGHVSYPYFDWQTGHIPRADTQQIDTAVVPASQGSFNSRVAFDTYLAGETVGLEVVAAGGAVFGSWSVSPNRGVLADTTSATTVYTLSDTNVVLTATFSSLLEKTVPDQDDLQDTNPWEIDLEPFASDTVAAPLKWTVSGGGGVIQPSLANNSFTAGGADTLTLMPVAGATGTDTITLELGDGTDTASHTFTVTLTSNQPVIFLTGQSLSSDTIPLIINGDDTREVIVSVKNTGFRGRLLVDTGNLAFMDDDGNTAGLDRALVGDTEIELETGDDTTITWVVTAPDTGEKDSANDFVPTIRVDQMSVLDINDSSVGAPGDSLPASPAPLKMAPIGVHMSDASVGADTLAVSMKQISVSAGVINGITMIDTSAFNDGDNLVVYVQRGDTNSFDTPVSNPAYGFTGQQDFRNQISAADGAFFGDDTAAVNGGLMTISIWRNQPGPSSNYIGDSDLWQENSTVTVSGINTNVPVDSLQVAKLIPGSMKWKVIDAQPTVSGSAGNRTVSFEVKSDTGIPGAGFSVFRVISGGGIGTGGSAGDAIVFPNPFIPFDGNSSTGEYGTGNGEGIHFGTSSGDGFPSGTKLKIFNVNGEKITEFTSNSGGIIQWDGTSENGGRVASGVYFWVLDVAGGGSKNGKLSIVR